MVVDERGTRMRMAAIEHGRSLGGIHKHLTSTELKPGFIFQGARIPLVNPQRGTFKPQQKRYQVVLPFRIRKK